MDRNTGGLGFNKNIAQMHAMLDKMPDSYLTQLVESKDPRATLALMVMGTRQEARKKITEAPTSSVADKVAAQTGLPSVAPQQNNQDPRLMAGMGGMNTNPVAERNSMDTPMTGVAQLPAQRMMADGGIVGYAEGDLVEGEEESGDTDYLAYLAGSGVVSALNPAKKAKLLYNIGKKGIQKLARPGGRLRRYGRNIQDRFTDRNYDLSSPNLLKRTFNPVKTGQTIASTAGTSYLLDKAFGDDEAPATMQQQQELENPLDSIEARDAKAKTATSNMFDNAISGITSGDMTRFGLNMAAQASKGGSGLTAIAGGAAETRKQIDTIENSNLDREFKQKYYDALANGQISKNVQALFERLMDEGGLRKATAELVAQGYTESDARLKAGQTLFAAANQAIASANATGATYPQGSNKGEGTFIVNEATP